MDYEAIIREEMRHRKKPGVVVPPELEELFVRKIAAALRAFEPRAHEIFEEAMREDPHPYKGGLKSHLT